MRTLLIFLILFNSCTFYKPKLDSKKEDIQLKKVFRTTEGDVLFEFIIPNSKIIVNTILESDNTTLVLFNDTIKQDLVMIELYKEDNAQLVSSKRKGLQNAPRGLLIRYRCSKDFLPTTLLVQYGKYEKRVISIYEKQFRIDSAIVSKNIISLPKIQTITIE